MTIHAHIGDLTTFCSAKTEVAVSLGNMKPHIRYFAEKCHRIMKGKQKRDIATFAPYIGRGLLEATFTALLFRIDPFRALTLMRFESHDQFDYNRPHQISMNWNFDLLSETDDTKDVWLPKQKTENVSRALLSPYQDEILWQPAFLEARDFLDRKSLGLAFPSMLSEDAEVFVKRIRGEARQLYSFWSKGIHCEFFSIGPHTLDDVTCSEKLKRTADIITELAFISHFTPITVGNIDPARAFRSYTKVKEALHA
jgi:hypothetical protein